MMERGAELFFEGLRRELGPALEDIEEMTRDFGPAMRSFIEEMGPAFGDIIDEVKDWTVYEPPEILPNGDIIIRRRPTPEEPAPEEPAPEDSQDPIDI